MNKDAELRDAELRDRTIEEALREEIKDFPFSSDYSKQAAVRFIRGANERETSLSAARRKLALVIEQAEQEWAKQHASREENVAAGRIKEPQEMETS